jgi:hypothetical protein
MEQGLAINEIISGLEKRTEFVSWKKNNPGAFLTHAFIVKDKEIFSKWQIGYYNPERAKITVFELGDPMVISPESEVFKDESTMVRALVKESIKIDYESALVTAFKVNKEFFPQIISNKQIMILQNLEMGIVWNITLISQSLEVLNIKIDASNGNVLYKNLSRLFEFRKN